MGLRSALTKTRRRLLASALSGTLFAGCMTSQQSTRPSAPTQSPAASQTLAPAPPQASASRAPAQSSTPPTPVTTRPFEDAVASAAHAVLSMVELPSPGEKYLVVIDPLIDGVSGVQSVATRTMESRVSELMRKKYPQFSLQPFTAANVRKSPFVVVGTFTPVNSQGQTAGVREAYRICLVLADLKSGKVISKGTAHAQMQGVNHTPTPYFQDSPAWMPEGSTESYVNTCQASKPGDSIQPVYRDSILTAALISEAITAYDAGRYQEALARYTSAAGMPAGNQLRVYNGLYLTNLKLGRQTGAAEAFGKIIDYGIAKNRLAVKFLFRPGSTAFVPDKNLSSQYPMWMKEIARRALQSNACLEIVGHTSRTGPEPMNERLSLLRAEFVKKRLEAEANDLTKRATANGVGSKENLVGTGKDDLSDALDRRVVFQVISCAT